jgi:hypothetical protein
MTATDWVLASGQATDGLGNVVDHDQPAPLPTNEPELVAFGNALLRGLRDVQGEIEANEAAETVEHQRLTNAYEDLNRPLAAREEWLTRELERIATALRPFFRGNAKSRSLPFGKIGWTEQPAKLHVMDEDRVRAWVAATCTQGERTKILEPVTKEALRKKELDALFFATGELPDGCELIPPGDKFYARPSISAPDVA